MGEVFVARDTELNREVALKEIQTQFAFEPQYRARFEFEAEVTGGLEHPGIVPVYGLGTYADGRPYYVMRFIKGDSLKEAIDRFHAEKSHDRRSRPTVARAAKAPPPLYGRVQRNRLRAFARRAASGHQARQYHRRTARRDPGGRLGPGQGHGQVRPVGRRADALAVLGQRIVRDVARLGPGHPGLHEPRAGRGPARAAGTAVGCLQPGCDAVLPVLTGKPPFSGEVADVIRAVQRGDFRPPRRLDPSIDPALEAICKKAMAHRSEDRYASCRALADDLDRWMADEPVTAWREPLARRARRWAQRNRTAVTAAAVALVAGVVGLVAVAGVEAQANSRLRAANTEVNRANTELAAEKARVQERYKLAMEAIETFHKGVSEDFLLKEAQFKDLRNRLLKSASDFYGKLGACLKDRSDRASRQALWQANYELAS